MKNIGQNRYNDRFEKLKKDLENSGKATVWIKKTERNDFKPTVFQIADRNEKIIYDFDESKSHSRFGFLISFAVGIFGIGLWLRHKYWKKPAPNKA